MARGDHNILNVLVVDDDEAMRTLLVDIISREEHQAVAAISAEHGLELLPYWTFHVAFLDLHLPGMDGIILGEYLRRSNPEMIIVIVSADTADRVERRSRDLSLRFLAKPFRVEDIQSVLNEANRRDRTVISTNPGVPDFSADFSTYHRELGEYYAMPKVPARIEDRLIASLRHCLNDLGNASRYCERDRVFALAGLLTAEVLGIQLPRANNGLTLFEEYDRIMFERGSATEFGGRGGE